MPDLIHITLDLSASHAELARLEPGSSFRGGILLELDLARQQAIVAYEPGDEPALEQGEEVLRKRWVPDRR